ncbi:hypothetical protein FGO68_gene16775 [Halteria grandinella]|uniref:Uncharacterized protein n=1 Tax=Halteria grandinella TaxID=5974 RepID=A0A8J8NXI5_HALGN|nr:hypothetical protein FGO68_gene16775 [Halteria grandinella]
MPQQGGDFILQDCMSQLLHFSDFILSLFQLMNNQLNSLLTVWYLSKAHTVRHFQLDCMVYRFLYVFIVTESLPLCIYRVNRSPRKDTPLYELTPIHRILSSLLRILSNNLIYFDDLSECKLAPTERYLSAALHDLIAHYILAPIQQLPLQHRVSDPLEIDDESFAELVHHAFVGLTRLVIYCTLWQYLD